MAREFARIGTDMPDEPSVRALTHDEQWLYDHALYLRREMSRCGVVPYRPAVWAELATDTTETKVRKWLKGLEKRRMVVVDERYSEVLVRTYVRHDGLLGQPNVVAAMVSDYRLISSPTIRNAFLAELRRLWDLPTLSPGERGGWCLAMGHYPQAKQGKDDHRSWPAVIDGASLARLTKSIGPGLATEMTTAIDAGHADPFDPGSDPGIPEPFGRTLHPNPLRGRDRGERHAPSPTPAPTPAPSAGSRAPEGTLPALPGGEHTHPDIETLLEQTGPYVPKIRAALAAELQPLAAAGIPHRALHAALEVWRGRKAGPKLLAHLVQDQLTPAQQQDPRFAGLLADARSSA